MTTTELAESSERIMACVITICAIAACVFITADQWGAVVWLGAG